MAALPTYQAIPADAEDAARRRLSAQVPKRKPVPTAMAQECDPTVDIESEMKKFAIVSTQEVPLSPMTTSTLSPTFNPPRFTKPIVIPGVCVADATYHPIGLPFVRAYPQSLAGYGISEERFLTFIDELNIMNRGHHQVFKNVTRAGKVVKAVGHFDPTQITQLVGASIALTGQIGTWASIEGPLSRKKPYVQSANESLFNPCGLKAEVVGTDELRKRLNLGKDVSLTAPLNPNWAVPAKEQLRKGQRCALRAPHRIILALLEHVQDVRLVAEANPLAGGPRSRLIITDDPTIDEATRKQQAAKNAVEVRNIQVGTEILMQTARSEAIALLRAANAITGTTDKELREKKKLLKKVGEKDREVHATKKMKWLFITNL